MSCSCLYSHKNKGEETSYLFKGFLSTMIEDKIQKASGNKNQNIQLHRQSKTWKVDFWSMFLFLFGKDCFPVSMISLK